MRQDSSWGIPVWLLSPIVGAVMVFSIAAYLALRRPSLSPPPPSPLAVVVHPCRAVATGMRRLGSGDLDIMFDLSDTAFALDVGGPDMPPTTVYYVTAKDAGASTLEISNGPTDFGNALNNAWPFLAAHFYRALPSGPLDSLEGYGERYVRDVHGTVIGKDRWGYVKSGKRWRLVKSFGREEAGYPPTPPREAKLFDQIISSACVSVAPRP